MKHRKKYHARKMWKILGTILNIDISVLDASQSGWRINCNFRRCGWTKSCTGCRLNGFRIYLDKVTFIGTILRALVKCNKFRLTDIHNYKFQFSWQCRLLFWPINVRKHFYSQIDSLRASQTNFYEPWSILTCSQESITGLLWAN